MNDRSGGPPKATGPADTGSDSAVDDAGQPTRVVGERPIGGVRRVARPLMAPNTVRQIRAARQRRLRRLRRRAARRRLTATGLKQPRPLSRPSAVGPYHGYLRSGFGPTVPFRRPRRAGPSPWGWKSVLPVAPDRLGYGWLGMRYSSLSRPAWLSRPIGIGMSLAGQIDITGLPVLDRLRHRWRPPVQVEPPTMEPVEDTEPGMDSAVDDSDSAPIILDQEVNLAPRRPAEGQPVGRPPGGDHPDGGAVSRSKQDAMRWPVELELDLAEEDTNSAVDEDEPTGKPSGHLDVAPFQPGAKPAAPAPSGDTATDDSDGVTPLAMTEGGSRDLAPTIESRMVSVEDRFAQEIGVDHDLDRGDDEGDGALAASGVRRTPRVTAVAAALFLVLVAAVVMLTRGGDEARDTVAVESTAGTSATAAVATGGTAAAATEEPAFQIAPVPSLIVCGDGTSFSGFPQPDGTVLDADTGEPRACPGSSN